MSDLSSPVSVSSSGASRSGVWMFVEPKPSPWEAWGRHVLLFIAAFASVFLVGASDGYSSILPLDVGAGLELACCTLAILLAHEMGHYLACRYYRVDATLPFFIPAFWVPVAAGLSVWMPIGLVGTFGAVIRIRGRIPHRKALFDIGIAGPLAGFVVAIPVLVLGIHEAAVVAASGVDQTMSYAEPWLLRLFVGWLRPLGADQTLVICPALLAAWFGMLVTALNLMPVGQLDGGHVTYALFRERANRLSVVVWWIALALIVMSPSWLLWAILLRVLGRSHPPTGDDDAPLGTPRVAVALLGAAVFALCFMPSPIVFSWATLWRELVSSR